ncbi:MAG: DUF5689 domain-containing protein [Prevotellaceae bacterium]|jgi:hypothetical protein|nr:DUF5689 domain-containing protein [Prevotellaceae bacterium]
MKSILLSSITLLAFLFAGCEKQYDAPAEQMPVVMQANMTIKELKALYRNAAPTIVNNPGAVVAGKVISTDRYGNFYRTFYIQDETAGIEIKIGTRTLYSTYTIGQEIYIKPHHLCLGDYGQMISLGFTSTNPKYQNSWIDVPMVINNSIFTGEMKAPVAPVEISNTASITADHMGTWVILKNATYKSGGSLTTWAKKNDPNISEDEAAYGEHVFTLSGGGDITVRTSGYAKFADTPLPFAAGAKVNLKGVLTRFNNTFQLVLNTDKDVEVVQ